MDYIFTFVIGMFVGILTFIAGASWYETTFKKG